MTLRTTALTLLIAVGFSSHTHAQVYTSVAAAGIHQASTNGSFTTQPELIVAGSNFWGFAALYDHASAVMEFPINGSGLRSNDQHYVAFEETGSTTVCAATPNRFRLYGFEGNGLADTADREQTNSLLLTFETPRGYVQTNRLLNVTPFVNSLIATGAVYVGFLITPDDGCAYEGFGYGGQNATNEPQVLFVSASAPPRLSISVTTSSPLALKLSWVEVPTTKGFGLESNADLSQTNGWATVTNSSSYFRYTRTVQVAGGAATARFYRLKKVL
jgi:hypothetical protein